MLWLAVFWQPQPLARGIGGRSPVDWELATGASSALVGASRWSASEGSTSMRSRDSSVPADGGHHEGVGTGPTAALAAVGEGRPLGGVEDPSHHWGLALAQPASPAAFHCGICHLMPGHVGKLAGPPLRQPKCSYRVHGLLALWASGRGRRLCVRAYWGAGGAQIGVT